MDEGADDVDLRLARLEALLESMPLLLSSVVLRQNPHNVHEWHKRAKLFEKDPKKAILVYTEAVMTVDPHKCIGKLHSLWVEFAKLYEHSGDLEEARSLFKRVRSLPLAAA